MTAISLSYRMIGMGLILFILFVLLDFYAAKLVIKFHWLFRKSGKLTLKKIKTGWLDSGVTNVVVKKNSNSALRNSMLLAMALMTMCQTEQKSALCLCAQSGFRNFLKEYTVSG